MISASKMGLLGICGWWGKADAPFVDLPGDSARDGTALHALIEHHLKGTLNDAKIAAILHDAVDSARVERAWVHAKAWMVAHATPWLRSEVAFVWDPETDKAYELTETLEALGFTGTRPYADPKAWTALRGSLGLSEKAIPGTADLVSVVDGEVVVYDWCLGVTDKRTQLRTLALMIARAQDLEEVRMVTLRVDDEGGVTPDDHGLIDSIDLTILAGEYAALVERVPASEPNPGGHCVSMYCPAVVGCPATAAAMADLIPPEALTKGVSAKADEWASFRMTVDIQSVEHAAWLLPRVNLLRDAAETIRDALKGWAKEHDGIPTSPGKTWAPGDVNRKSFSREKAETLLRLLGATEEDIASCFVTSTSVQFRERNEKSRAKGSRSGGIP